MRGALAAVIAIGCGAPTTPISNVSPAPSTAAGLPCGVTAIYELSPFDDPPCEPDGTCMQSAVRRSVGTCRIAASSAFDLRAGEGRSTVLDGDRPILSSDARPYARTVVFDPRVPTPDGIRVGMTGAEVERLVNAHAEARCTFDDPDWQGHLLCRFRLPLECDAEDANWLLVVFEPGGLRPVAVSGDAARSLIRTRRVVAVDLGPDCGGD